jgi:hypothetical protein
LETNAHLRSRPILVRGAHNVGSTDEGDPAGGKALRGNLPAAERSRFPLWQLRPVLHSHCLKLHEITFFGWLWTYRQLEPFPIESFIDAQKVCHRRLTVPSIDISKFVMSAPPAVAPTRIARTLPSKEVYEAGQPAVTGPLLRAQISSSSSSNNSNNNVNNNNTTTTTATATIPSTSLVDASISVDVARDKFSVAQLNTDHQNYSDTLNVRLESIFLTLVSCALLLGKRECYYQHAKRNYSPEHPPTRCYV